MSDFFDKLGAAARRTADTVNTQVSIAAEEQRVREAYQALGKLYYQAVKAGKTPEGDDFDAVMARAAAALKRIQELKARKNVAPTAEDEDFVDVD